MDLDSLRSEWSVDDVSVVGRTIYESVPPDKRPDWAGALLLYAAGENDLCSELKTIVELSFSDSKWIWMNAHDAFQAVRKLTLRSEKAGRRSARQQLVLDIGETAAKVIYNSSGGPAPFDHDVGWGMAARVKRLALLVAQNDFEDNCWHLLIRRQSK